MRKQFTFYESFFSALKRIRKDADRAKAYDAICSYALTGEMPDMDAIPDAAAIAFELVKPTLDSSARKSESGKNGGSKTQANDKQTTSKTEANRKQTASKQKANDKQTASEKEGEKEKEGEIEVEVEKENECLIYLPSEDKKARSRFAPPTIDEVKAYCSERGAGVDAQKWYDHYSANGWMVGKNRMKDWKAAVRTWERSEYADKPKGRDHPITPAKTSRSSLDALDALMERVSG